MSSHSSLSKRLAADISAENAAHYFFLSKRYINCWFLNSKLTDFIADNWAAVRKSSGWKLYIEPNVDLAPKLLDSLASIWTTK